MLRVTTTRFFGLRLIGLGLAALLTTGAALAATASFEAPGPGMDLDPVGGAGALVDLIQGQEHIVWSALTGTVTSYTAVGWPSTIGDAEIGGAMVIERPADGSAGVIDFGDKPMSLEFHLER